MTRTRKAMPMSGWCESGNHHVCPHLLRAHRFTDKGTELRELVCPCKCHSKAEPAAYEQIRLDRGLTVSDNRITPTYEEHTTMKFDEALAIHDEIMRDVREGRRTLEEAQLELGALWSLVERDAA